MQASIQRQLREMEQMGGAEFVNELIELFFSECDMRFTKLEAALGRDDLAEAGRIFHQVKGSAASTGTGRLHRICNAGEMASDRGDSETARRAGRLGAKELQHLRSVLHNWRQDPAS